MAQPRIAPYGEWESPISAAMTVAGAVALHAVCADGPDLYWSELRPADGGRVVVVRRTAAGERQDITPAPFNARTRVHEYGGGAHLVHDGVVYFSNFADQRLYRQAIGGAPEAISRIEGMRYAEAAPDPRRGRLILIREDHTVEGREAVNTVVSMAMNGDDERVLVSGNDFYSNPVLSPDGTRLAWLTWNHPNMPWDGTELWLATVGDDGSLTGSRLVAGGAEESIFQPRWSPDGVLYFVSDR